MPACVHVDVFVNACTRACWCVWCVSVLYRIRGTWEDEGLGVHEFASATSIMRDVESARKTETERKKSKTARERERKGGKEREKARERARERE